MSLFLFHWQNPSYTGVPAEITLATDITWRSRFTVLSTTIVSGPTTLPPPERKYTFKMWGETACLQYIKEAVFKTRVGYACEKLVNVHMPYSTIPTGFRNKINLALSYSPEHPREFFKVTHILVLVLLDCKVKIRSGDVPQLRKIPLLTWPPSPTRMKRRRPTWGSVV